MNTIHDVLRFILNSLRSQAGEQAINDALAVVAAHEAGQAKPADPSVPPAAFHSPEQGGF